LSVRQLESPLRRICQAKWESIPIRQDTKCCRSESESGAEAFPLSIDTT
jgi:hypothetical protein